MHIHTYLFFMFTFFCSWSWFSFKFYYVFWIDCFDPPQLEIFSLDECKYFKKIVLFRIVENLTSIFLFHVLESFYLISLLIFFNFVYFIFNFIRSHAFREYSFKWFYVLLIFLWFLLWRLFYFDREVVFLFL